MTETESGSRDMADRAEELLEEASKRLMWNSPEYKEVLANPSDEEALYRYARLLLGDKSGSTD